MALRAQPNQREAENCAWELIQEMNITSFPVLPLEIAQRKGILVQPFPSPKPGMAGCLLMVGNQFGIGYANHLDNEGFINFTVGHELGHFHLPGHVEFLFGDGSQVHYSASPFTSAEPHERQADAFSAALLMPKELFVLELRKAGAGFAAIKKLAATCRTSLSATAIRYGQLAEHPVAIVVSSGAEVEYAVIGPALERIPGVTSLNRGGLLPVASATCRFNRDYENVLRAENVESLSSLRDWFPEAPDHQMNEDVVGLGKYNKTLTVLFAPEEIPTAED